MTRVIDSKVLVEMCKRILPEMREGDSLDALVQKGDAESAYEITFDARSLSASEFATLKQIAQDVADRQNGVVESGQASMYEDRFRVN